MYLIRVSCFSFHSLCEPSFSPPLHAQHLFAWEPFRSDWIIFLTLSKPNLPALIDPRYLTDEGNNDRNVLLVGLRVCLKMMQSPAFKAYFDPVPINDDPTSYWWPYSSSNPDAITDDQLRRFMNEKAFTLYHPVGSARMGSSPATSVVDPECRVHGVKGLRVMDASVFPEQISGHPTAPIAAMAAKLSAMIAHGAVAAGPIRANL